MTTQYLNGATGSSVSSTFTISAVVGTYSLQVGGTFDGAQVDLEGSLDNGTTFAVLEDLTFTSAAIKMGNFFPGPMRLHVTGGGTSTAIDSWVTLNRK